MSGEDDLLKRLGGLSRARDTDAREHAPSLSPDFLTAAVVAQQRAERAQPSKPAPRPVSRWLAVALPLAAAFALTIGKPWATTAAPLGPFVASVSGHVEDNRGAAPLAAATLESRVGATQEVVVRPVTSLRDPVGAAVLIVRRARVERFDGAVAVSESGGVRFEIEGARLVDANAVRVVVARPADLAAAVRGASGESVGDLPGAALVVLPVEAPR